MPPMWPNQWDQFCNYVERLRNAGLLSKELRDRLDYEAERLYDAGVLSDDRVLRLSRALLSADEAAFIDALAYGIAKLMHTPINQLTAEGM